VDLAGDEAVLSMLLDLVRHLLTGIDPTECGILFLSQKMMALKGGVPERQHVFPSAKVKVTGIVEMIVRTAAH